ncbi:hypothetical protein [Serratia fonticola]|uniref:hypothetical protein n=1 Tax=Serratia fonticola TaxID=47917 RepID=UPI0021780333|nr:hypothetical protein [Serratia fonticola]CAI1785701.1 Uncharacterised protein [Serratia fonticola]
MLEPFLFASRNVMPFSEKVAEVLAAPLTPTLSHRAEESPEKLRREIGCFSPKNGMKNSLKQEERSRSQFSHCQFTNKMEQIARKTLVLIL